MLASICGGEASLLEEADFQDEGEIREFISKREVLEGIIRDIAGDSSLKLENTVAEYQVGSGKVDLFARDSSGAGYIFEVKHSQRLNPREVVGQVVEYASQLSSADYPGGLRLVIASDRIPERLAGMIRYLRSIGLDIYGLEVRRYTSGDCYVVSYSIVGVEEIQARPAGKKVTLEDIWNAIKGVRDERLRRNLETITRWAMEKGVLDLDPGACV